MRGIAEKPISINDLKSHYDELLAREKRGEEYLDDPARTPDEIEKWMPEFRKILVALNDTLAKIGSFTAIEVVYGFNFRDKKDKGIPIQQEMNLLIGGIVNE